jgi:hypothetical protein
MIHSFFFREIGFNPDDYDVVLAYRNAVQLACQHLMDTVYMDFNEADVIQHENIVVDYKTGAVIVPCRQVYKPEYLH